VAANKPFEGARQGFDDEGARRFVGSEEKRSSTRSRWRVKDVGATLLAALAGKTFIRIGIPRSAPQRSKLSQGASILGRAPPDPGPTPTGQTSSLPAMFDDGRDLAKPAARNPSTVNGALRTRRRYRLPPAQGRHRLADSTEPAVMRAVCTRSATTGMRGLVMSPRV
jgi:hypothetical protein